MLDFQDNNPEFDKVNQNVAHLLTLVDFLLKMAAYNGGNEFNIFLTSNSSSTKIEYFKSIDNV